MTKLDIVDVKEAQPSEAHYIPPRHRLISECSSGDGLENMEPLDLDDLTSFQNKDKSLETVRPSDGGRRVVKRYRFRVNESDEGPIMLAPVNPLFAVTMQLKRQLSGGAQGTEVQTRAKRNWKNALRGLAARSDPWAEFHWEEMKVENATRYRYNPLTKKWHEEEVVVKIEEEPFGKGAMRECYRMKKLSNFSHSQDWNRSSNNYVAKSYLEEVSRDTYFQDVKLQMDAKLWGEEYNRHNPPKKVDIFMMAVLEFHERQGKPLFHVEHFIDGEYIKYNSNSGFVEDSVCRKTPHAFSHFTFERSGHELIVVDVQGVGDLYTDPQIHTADGIGYGDGNLGTKGMALFFHSHTCNDICLSLGLSKFDLTRTERQVQSRPRLPSETVCKPVDVVQCESPSATERNDFAEFFRSRARSNSNGRVCIDVQAAKKVAQQRVRRRAISDYYSMEDMPSLSPPILEGKVWKPSPDSINSTASSTMSFTKQRERNLTESSDDSGIVNSKTDMLSFQELLNNKAKPSNVNAIDRDTMLHDDSILGQVHLDLARYHETCRFTTDGTYDKEAALFHLKCAADCGIISAIVTLAKMYMGLHHDLLEEVEPPEKNEEEKAQQGFRYMQEAADACDRNSMVFVARAFDSGMNLPSDLKQSAKLALYWYERITDMDEEEPESAEWGMDDAPYLLLARQAEILLSDNSDVDKNPSRAGELYNAAAESAMNCMKGKLANKYYMLAEEAYGQCEEDEE